MSHAKAFKKLPIIVGAIVGVTLLKLVLGESVGARVPFVLFYGAIALVTYGAGGKAGILATVLAGVSAHLFFLKPIPALPASNGPWFLTEALFLLDAGVIVWVASALRGAKASLEKQMQERQLAQKSMSESEARFRMLADSVPQLVWTARADGSLDYCNERWVAYTGLTPEQSRGWGWMTAVHPDDIKRTEEPWRQALRTGEAFSKEYRLHCAASGEYRWHLGLAHSMRDASGAIVTWFMTSTDIHEQKITEAELRTQQEDLSTQRRQLEWIFNNTRAALALFEAHPPYRVLAHNNRYLEFVDEPFRTQGVTGLTLPEFLPTARDFPWQDLFDRAAMQREEIRNTEVPFSLPARGLTWWNWHLSPIMESSRVKAIAYLAYDVTESVQMKEHLKAAKHEAEVASRMKDEFFATLSHELRTPLHGIMGWASLLRARFAVPDPIFREGLTRVEEGAVSLARLVEDMLDVSRIITGKLILKVGEVDFLPLLDAALDIVRFGAEAKGVGLDFTLEGPPPLALSGDGERLRQVLSNLLGNALKFTEPGGRITITLDTKAKDRLILKVADTGVGISPEFLPHMFERFRQGALDAGNRTRAGLGLGLAISQYIMELHGGSIEAHSDGPGRGSTFTVTLPIAAGSRDPV